MYATKLRRMQNNGSTLFLDLIKNLRQREDLTLSQFMLEFPKHEAEAVIEFLRNEFSREALNHPFEVPEFDPNASLWAANTVYVAAQLILYREHKETELGLLLRPYEGERNASAFLSSDLTLRFLPDMINTLKMVDTEDALIPLLESTLQVWHFSWVDFPLDPGILDFSVVENNRCLHQLYCDRIIENKRITFATHPVFKDSIRAQLGLYGNDLWKEFVIATSAVLHE